MKRLMMVILMVGMLFSCDVIAPNVSKAKTEKEQVELLKTQNELLKKQNTQLTRIADSLEKMEGKVK